MRLKGARVIAIPASKLATAASVCGSGSFRAREIPNRITVAKAKTNPTTLNQIGALSKSNQRIATSTRPKAIIVEAARRIRALGSVLLYVWYNDMPASAEKSTNDRIRSAKVILRQYRFVRPLDKPGVTAGLEKLGVTAGLEKLGVTAGLDKLGVTAGLDKLG